MMYLGALKARRALGRPRSFDEEKALEAATNCFWARGYEATSVRDLSDSMGIGGASLYNAYGGKRALFAAALELYCNRSARERIARLDGCKAGLAAIDGFFGDVIEKSLSDCDRKGCFLVNAALEMAPHDAELAAMISAYFTEVRSFFQRNILAGQARREIRLEADAESHSKHLLSVLIGLRVLARLNLDPAYLEAAAAPAIQSLRRLPNKEQKEPA